MAIHVPDNFDVNSIPLDVCEMYVRDELNLNLLAWGRFRATINIGVDSAKLRGKTGTVPDAVKDAYRSLGRSHYEVIVSLGCAAVALRDGNVNSLPSVLFRKSQKDFYFHIGCLLDNLARLIFIVNHPRGATEQYPSSYRQGDYVRNWIDWGDLKRKYVEKSPSDFAGFKRITRSPRLKAIIHMRHGFTHGWSPPFRVQGNPAVSSWPIAIRSKRNLRWPHDEEDAKIMRQKYRSFVPILHMMAQDMDFVERLQSEAFSRLTRQIGKFERNNGVVIVE
jgi:hypothetical protein